MRAVLMAHGKFGTWTSKTATSILRYSDTYETVAVLDKEKAGDDAAAHVGDIGQGVPIVGTIGEALDAEPDVLIIGIAPVGGELPGEWRHEIRTALAAGVDVVSGLHAFLGDDPELAEAAAAGGASILDLRRPTRPPRVATGEGRDVAAPVVHTMGTDCSSGKMTAAIELCRAARTQGIDAGFAATGQTGLLLGPDAGVPIDHVVADFVAGAAEDLVLQCDAQGKHIIFVEGQGATTHPAYSGVTVGLMHGCFPDVVVLCHQAGRTTKGEYGDPARPFPILPLAEEVEIIERLLAPVSGGRVAAVALATHGLAEEEARAAIRRAEETTGLPADDVVRFGAERVLEAVLDACARLEKKGVERLRMQSATKPN